MSVLAHWFHFNYAPSSGPWYGGAVWPNVFVVLVLAPLGWLWSRTKWWPLKPLRHGLGLLHSKADALRSSHEDLHGKVAALHARHDQHEANHAAVLERLERVGRSVAELHEKLEG